MTSATRMRTMIRSSASRTFISDMSLLKVSRAC